MRRGLAGIVVGVLGLMPALPGACVSAGSLPAEPTLAQESQSVNAVCGKCHGMQLVMDSPMDYDSWHDIVQKMLDRGADATDDQLQDIMDWLHHTLTTINVNSADPDELQLVLDVTPQVARDIVARRTAHRFADLADLKSVPGIDSSVLDAKTRLIFFQ